MPLDNDLLTLWCRVKRLAPDDVRRLITELQETRDTKSAEADEEIKSLEEDVTELRSALEMAGEFTDEDLADARAAGDKAGYARGCKDGRAEGAAELAAAKDLRDIARSKAVEDQVVRIRADMATLSESLKAALARADIAEALL